MPSVFDTAQYILSRTGVLTTMKLQKLCYYAQAWSLVWDEQPLFNEEIQAWSNGPVIPALYNAHKGMYAIDALSIGDGSVLSSSQQETVNTVIDFYSQYNPQQLSDLTHMEDPWKNARSGIPDQVRSTSTISHSSMAEYYSSLDRNGQKA